MPAIIAIIMVACGHVFRGHGPLLQDPPLGHRALRRGRVE